MNESLEQLKNLIERIESIEEEKAEVVERIKEAYGEAKATGFDTKIIRMIVKLRAKDKSEIQEEQALLEMYMNALGME